jgi:hypothetical protein
MVVDEIVRSLAKASLGNRSSIQLPNSLRLGSPFPRGLGESGLSFQPSNQKNVGLDLPEAIAIPTQNQKIFG